MNSRARAASLHVVLELCKGEKLVTETTWAELKVEPEVLSKMVTALIKGTDKR
jgi:hypothetical protein